MQGQRCLNKPTAAQAWGAPERLCPSLAPAWTEGRALPGSAALPLGALGMCSCATAGARETAAEGKGHCLVFSRSHGSLVPWTLGAQFCNRGSRPEFCHWEQDLTRQLEQDWALFAPSKILSQVPSCQWAEPPESLCGGSEAWAPLGLGTCPIGWMEGLGTPPRTSCCQDSHPVRSSPLTKLLYVLPPPQSRAVLSVPPARLNPAPQTPALSQPQSRFLASQDFCASLV